MLKLLPAKTRDKPQKLPLQCIFCGKEFKTREKLKQHITKGGIMDKIIVLRCPKCGKKAGRAVKEGRVCGNCGFKGSIEEFIVRE
jgi:predicted RNA-binding Zn-ribbon protein involved in translation (DUF1610 family)